MVSRETPATSPETMYPSDVSMVLRDRLSRIEGHVRGIKRMVDESRSCEEILTQIAGVKAAIDQVALRLLEYDLENCVVQAIHAGQPTEAISRHKKSLGLLFR